MRFPGRPGPANEPTTTAGQLVFGLYPPNPGVPRLAVPQLPPSHDPYAYVGLMVNPLNRSASTHATIAHQSFWCGAMNRSTCSLICTKLTLLRTFRARALIC